MHQIERFKEDFNFNQTTIENHRNFPLETTSKGGSETIYIPFLRRTFNPTSTM
jgi:hypothetical protein